MKKFNKLHFLLWFLISLKLTDLRNVIAEEPPKKKTTEDQRAIIFAQINETVMLKCPVESSPDFITYIDWMKGNVSLYTEQGYEITPKGHLKIKAVLDKHSGIYTCEAVNGYGYIRVNLTLLVVDQELETSNYASPHRNVAFRIHSSPPSIIKRPTSVTSEVGGEANFHCVSSGQPVPRIFWVKDGKLLQDSNSYTSNRKIHSTLKLKDLKKSDAGDYKCIARNMRGEDETDFTLTVSDTLPPPNIIALDPEDATVKKGASIALVCEVDSRPDVQKVHIKWLKKQDGVDQLPESVIVTLFRSGKFHYRPLNVTDNELILNGNVYVSKLYIHNSCEEDSGIYVCLALNDKGYNFRNTTLKVISAPEKFATESLQPENGVNQGAIIIGAGSFSVLLLILILVCLVPSYLCNKCKSEENKKANGTSISNVESGRIKQSSTSIRNQSKGDKIPYPEIGDPLSRSKLLSVDSTNLYNHSESQISKTAHTKTPFH